MKVDMDGEYIGENIQFIMNKKQRQLFIDTFRYCQVNFINELTVFGESMMTVLDGEDLSKYDWLQSDEDFKEYAKQAFLFAVKQSHDRNDSQESALREIRDILRSDSKTDEE